MTAGTYPGSPPAVPTPNTRGGLPSCPGGGGTMSHCRESLGRAACRRIKELKSRGTYAFPQCPPCFDWVNFDLSVSLVYTY